MDFDAAYREGYVAGVTAHVEHSRCQRCYDAGQARVAALTAALETARTLWFNALFDQGTPRELHVIWYNEWLAKLDAAGGTP